MNTEIETKYNILRGECHRISKKLDYYESGRAFEALTKKHEKETKSLKYKLEAWERDYRKMSEKNTKNIPIT